MVVLDRIKESSKEKGWALSFLASKLGLTASYFTDVKNGKTKISDERLATIASILDTTPEYLKGDTDQKGPASTSEAHREEERRILERMRSGKNQMLFIGERGSQEIIEITDEEAALMRVALKVAREAKAKDNS